MTLINVFTVFKVFTCFHLLAVGAAPLVNLLEVDADGDGTGVPALRGFAAYATSDAVVTEADEPGHLSAADRLRALTPRPLPTSHVHGSDARTAFAAMNVHLTHAEPVQVAPCAVFTHAALNAVSRTLFALRNDELQLIYTNAADKRALHFQSIEYKEELWDRGAPTDTMRDGKCAEAVMWYIHHLSQEQRQRLATVDDFVLPLMPEDMASIEEREAEFDGGSEYDKMLNCNLQHFNFYRYATSGEACFPVPQGECAAAGNQLEGWSKSSSEVIVGVWNWLPCGCYIFAGRNIQFNRQACARIRLTNVGRTLGHGICRG